MQAMEIVQREILLKIKIKIKLKSFYMWSPSFKDLCAILQWLEEKFSRRVSIYICGHSVKNPKQTKETNQNQKTSFAPV